MAREVKRLSARSVQTITKPGRHADGGGLYLVGRKVVVLGATPPILPKKIFEPAELVSDLTEQQRRVFVVWGEGLYNKQIAHIFSVSEATVNSHVSRLRDRLQVTSRTEAAICSSWLATRAPI